MTNKTVKYYFGDPSYCMDEDLYNAWGNMNSDYGMGFPTSDKWIFYKDKNDERDYFYKMPNEFKDRFIAVDTEYGDGTFKALRLENNATTLKRVTKFNVDAGMLSIIQEELWKDDFEFLNNKCKYGTVIALPGTFEDYTLDFIGWKHDSNSNNKTPYRELIIKEKNSNKTVFRIFINTELRWSKYANTKSK